jgi:uncharacterized protein involved in exopolysaccharide biosynthesis
MQPDSKISEGEISIKEIASKIKKWWRYLVSQWVTIVCFGLAGAVIGLMISLLTKPVYKAELSFVIESSGKSANTYAGLAAQFGLNLGSSGGMFQESENILALLKSRAMITRALLSSTGVDNELIVDRFINMNEYRENWKGSGLEKLSFRNISQGSRVHDSLLGLFYKNILRENLSVEKPDKKNDIIVITTTGTDEIFSQSFTQELLQNVSQYYIETQTKKQKENVQILRFQADSVRRLLNSAITGVALSGELNPNQNPAYLRLQVPSQKRMVDVETNKAILVELVKNLEIAEITLRKETPLFQVIDSPVLPLEKKRFGKLRGIVYGGLVGGALIILFLSLRMYLRALLK